MSMNAESAFEKAMSGMTPRLWYSRGAWCCALKRQSPDEANLGTRGWGRTPRNAYDAWVREMRYTYGPTFYGFRVCTSATHGKHCDCRYAPLPAE